MNSTKLDSRLLAQKKEEVRMGLIFVTGLFLFFFTIMFFIYRNIHTIIHHDMVQEQFRDINTMEKQIQDVFTRIEVYLSSVSNLYTVGQILKKEDPVMRNAVERFFSKLIEENINQFTPTFDQIRLLDLEGMEIIRVDLDRNSMAKVCRVSQLQDKSSRYYFQEAMELSKNQIYMSPMDLNVEHGKIEIPHKPMIRFAVPVFDNGGERTGILVFNYLAQQISEKLNAAALQEGNQWILLNEDGYYLHGPDPDKNFGFMFPEKNPGFFSDYPDVWEAFSNSMGGKFDRPEGVYYRNIIKPFALDTTMTLARVHTWTFLMFVTRKNIHQHNKLLIHGLLMGSIILLPILLLMGWLLGKSRVKNRWHLKDLEDSATRDGLTGLLNHRAAMDLLEYQINVANRSGNPLHLSYIDLNNLKIMNDIHGHQNGDKMIILAAESMICSIRNTDIAARIGGDEFLIIFPGLTSGNLEEVVGRIEATYERKSLELFKKRLTLSWGGATWEGESDTAENFINRADKEMYKMKKEYKACSSATPGTEGL